MLVKQSRIFEFLESDPELGRSFGDVPELRELVIEFGEARYVALYRLMWTLIQFLFWLFGIKKKRDIRKVNLRIIDFLMADRTGVHGLLFESLPPFQIS